MTDNKSSSYCPQAIKLLGDLEETFSLLADKSSSTGMTFEAVEEWLLKARVLDDHTFKKADLEDYFQKLESNEISFPHFQGLLKELAVKKNMDVEKLSEQLGNVHHPSDTNLESSADLETKNDERHEAVDPLVEDIEPDSGCESDKPSSAENVNITLDDELEQLSLGNVEEPSNIANNE